MTVRPRLYTGLHRPSTAPASFEASSSFLKADPRGGAPLPPERAARDRLSERWMQVSFLCLITPLCSYLYGGLYGGLYERAHIIRYFPP